jgi:hypothetical protein
MMVFFGGRVNIGVSLSSLKKRREAIAKDEAVLVVDIDKAYTARREVLATVGAEMDELAKLQATLTTVKPGFTATEDDGA